MLLGAEKVKITKNARRRMTDYAVGDLGYALKKALFHTRNPQIAAIMMALWLLEGESFEPNKENAR
jgi:hypothetical protein